MPNDQAASNSGDTEFLSFTLGGLEYGLDFAKVQELRVLKSLERFAADGELIDGVAVSRGVIMPIVDMRSAFAGRPLIPGPMTDVIILKLSSCVMGMVVDSVTGVVTLSPDKISAIPGEAGQVDYLVGVGVVDGRRLIIVDIDKLMSIDRKSEERSRHVA
jgi:purine-binding chemotaxis protein CheW